MEIKLDYVFKALGIVGSYEGSFNDAMINWLKENWCNKERYIEFDIYDGGFMLNLMFFNAPYSIDVKINKMILRRDIQETLAEAVCYVYKNKD